MVEQLALWERDAFLAINAAHTPYWDAFMYLISSRWPWIAVAFGLVIFLFAKKPLRESILLVLMIALLITVADQLSSGLIKPYFERLRPSYHPLTADLVQSVYGYKAWGYELYGTVDVYRIGLPQSLVHGGGLRAGTDHSL